jgi:hypothetical protein
LKGKDRGDAKKWDEGKWKQTSKFGEGLICDVTVGGAREYKREQRSAVEGSRFVRPEFSSK